MLPTLCKSKLVAKRLIIGVKGGLFHLGFYGLVRACLWGQCEALPLEPAAGEVERSHNIQSRGDCEGSGVLQLT